MHQIAYGHLATFEFRFGKDRQQIGNRSFLIIKTMLDLQHRRQGSHFLRKRGQIKQAIGINRLLRDDVGQSVTSPMEYCSVPHD